MLRILLIISSIVLFSGCGSGSEEKSNERTSPLEVVDRDVQYLDSYWLPGGRNYAAYENSLAISHYGGVSLLNINESGLVESEIQVSGTGASNIATLENGDIATLMVNHVRINRLENNMFDVVHMTQESPDLSAVILASFDNCAYWVSRGSAELSQNTIEEVCIDSQNQVSETVKYETANWINNIFVLADGSMLVFEPLSDQMRILLLNREFSIIDEYITTDKLFGFDIEFRNNTVFFTGFTAVWRMDILPDGLTEPKKFHEAVNPTGSNGTNLFAVHDKGVLIADNNFVYAYKLNGDEVSAIYRTDVEKDIEALVVYKDFLIVSYWDNVDFEIYKISDLL